MSHTMKNNAPVIWNPRHPPLWDTQNIYFYCQWNEVKAPPYGEKIQGDLPHLLNVKLNSLNRFNLV